MDWERAIAEIAFVDAERVAVREAGFTDAALAFPRSEAGLVALCAFNGIKPEQAPPGWRYWPNAGMKACWERVIAAMGAAECCEGGPQWGHAWDCPKCPD